MPHPTIVFRTRVCRFDNATDTFHTCHNQFRLVILHEAAHNSRVFLETRVWIGKKGSDRPIDHHNNGALRRDAAREKKGAPAKKSGRRSSTPCARSERLSRERASRRVRRPRIRDRPQRQTNSLFVRANHKQGPTLFDRYNLEENTRTLGLI